MAGAAAGLHAGLHGSETRPCWKSECLLLRMASGLDVSVVQCSLQALWALLGMIPMCGRSAAVAAVLAGLCHHLITPTLLKL